MRVDSRNRCVYICIYIYIYTYTYTPTKPLSGLSFDALSPFEYYLRDCQNYGPFLGPYYTTGPSLRDPKRDHNFDNPPFVPGLGFSGAPGEAVFC